jgi:hypothetical protein
VRQRHGKLAGRVASHEALPLDDLLEHLVREHERDARDEEHNGAVPEEARASADEDRVFFFRARRSVC